jgi:hypothetical protein
MISTSEDRQMKGMQVPVMRMCTIHNNLHHVLFVLLQKKSEIRVILHERLQT